MFAIFNIVLMTVLGALLAAAALRAGDQTEIFRVQRAQQGFVAGKAIIDAYYYEKNILPDGNLSNLRSDGYAPLSLSELALYSKQLGLTEAVNSGELGWTYDRAVLAVQRASNIRTATTFLNQSACPGVSATTAFASSKSWCPTDVVISQTWETRADMALRTAKIRTSLQRTMQKFADYYSEHPSTGTCVIPVNTNSTCKKFPQPGGTAAANPGTDTSIELRALVGQATLTSAACTGVYANQFATGTGDNYTYMTWDCSDLFTPYGQPVTYQFKSTAEIRLAAPVGALDQTGAATSIGVNFTL